MKMILHQTEGMNPKGKNLGIFRQIVQELIAIAFVTQGNIPSIRSGNSMIKGSGKIYSSCSSHTERLSKTVFVCQFQTTPDVY